MDTGIGRAACLVAIAVAGSLTASGASAQEVERSSLAPASELGRPVALAPPIAVSPTTPGLKPAEIAATAPESADNRAAVAEPSNTVIPPVGPPVPAHAQAAVLRVLDKVTAETMAFAAPIGARVRYKSLVFEVKSCVTRGPGDAQPEPSAYLTITSDAGANAGGVIGPRQVFKGWMFANAPGLHALKHPVYDAWLVSCSASTPRT